MYEIEDMKSARLLLIEWILEMHEVQTGKQVEKG